MFESNTKFLVVDDFSTMRKIVKKALSELGYTNVIEAVDGRDALDKLNEALAKNEHFHFIISDWSMPKMQGIELLKACKQSPQLCHVPFILVTAESEQAQIIEAVKAGVSEYVVKPFSAQILKSKIEKVYQKNIVEKKAV
ncbi:MAG: response regulator [Pseudobdellovibrio sp.]